MPKKVVKQDITETPAGIIAQIKELTGTDRMNVQQAYDFCITVRDELETIIAGLEDDLEN